MYKAISCTCENFRKLHFINPISCRVKYLLSILYSHLKLKALVDLEKFQVIFFSIVQKTTTQNSEICTSTHDFTHKSKIQSHSCQVSRIGRETHGFSNSLTVSRSMDEISRILANLTNFSLSTINLDNLCNFKCQECQFQPILEVSFSKFSGGACPQTPLEGLKKLFSPLHGSKNFFRSKFYSCQFQKVDNYAELLYHFWV